MINKYFDLLTKAINGDFQSSFHFKHWDSAVTALHSKIIELEDRIKQLENNNSITQSGEVITTEETVPFDWTCDVSCP